MKRLSLTGWGWKDYACAAALALRHFKTGEILGMSTRRLPEFLNDCTGWNEIVILGIGLSGDPELLAKAELSETARSLLNRPARPGGKEIKKRGAPQKRG